MKKSEISVGGVYLAKVSGKLTQVRVDSMGLGGLARRQQTTYLVTNLATGRRTTFRSATKFRSSWQAKPATEAALEEAVRGKITLSPGSVDKLAGRLTSEDLGE